MKNIIMIGYMLFVCAAYGCTKAKTEFIYSDKNPHVNTGKYDMSASGISEEVLNNYLSRAVTHTELLSSEGYYTDIADDATQQADNERMLLNIGAKFVGRSLFQWSFENYFSDSQWLAAAKTKIDRMHAKDPDIIFQAGAFEIVTTKVNSLDVPAWVFEAFAQPVVTRKFIYNDMLNLDGQYVNHFAPNQSVPDISRTEAQMFYYYMAKQYIDAGIEAIHFGVVEMTSMYKEENYKHWASVLKKVRDYAKQHSRRGYVLCDGHMHGGGLAVDGHLLFDFVSFPIVPKELKNEPQKAIIEKFHGNLKFHAIYGRTKGGITPSGWRCTHAPYIVEFDNMGISKHPGEASSSSYDGFVWGYDEITWFYLQSEEYRNSFLEYLVERIKVIDPYGFIQIPCRRVVEPAAGARACYNANTKSSDSPKGMSQETTIKNIFSKP